MRVVIIVSHSLVGLPSRYVLIVRIVVADLIDNFQRLAQQVLHFETSGPTSGNVRGFLQQEIELGFAVQFTDEFVLEAVADVIDQKVHDGLGDQVNVAV